MISLVTIATTTNILEGGWKMATITKDMTVMEVLRLNEGAASVFRSFGLQCLG